MTDRARKLLENAMALSVIASISCGKPDTGNSNSETKGSTVEISETKPAEPGSGSSRGFQRYIVDAEVITDRTSGLSWEHTTPQNLVLWPAASKLCEKLVAGGHDDWRIPTLAELDTITRQGGAGNWSTVMSSETWHCESNGPINSGVPFAFLTGLVSR